MTKIDLVIIGKNRETESISSFILGSADGTVLPIYSAGSHIEVDLGDVGKRCYSLIDGLNAKENTYHIAVQKEANGQGGSIAMHALNVGDRLKTSTPKNDFAMADSDASFVLIAGGIGITPIISMAHKLHIENKPFAFHFAGRSKESMAFIPALQEKFANKLHVHFDNEIGLDLDAVFSATDKSTHIYVCGPKGMIEAAKSKAEAAGFASNQIHFEIFVNKGARKDDKAFEVEIAATGDTYQIPADKTIIEALEEAGLDITHDCQRGDCGICQVDVLEGEVDHRDVVLSDEEKASNKKMQICVSRAKSKRLVLDLKTAKTAQKKQVNPQAKTRLNNYNLNIGHQRKGKKMIVKSEIENLFREGRVHRDVYTSKEIYDLEMKHLFFNTWVFVGHESQTANEGDYFATQIGNQPVIQVRHNDGEIHVLYNRCPHKGTKIVIDRSGNTGKFFRCPYHAWSFKTDGCLLAIPLNKGYENTKLNDSENAKGMKAVGAVKNYRGFIFARLADEGIDFDEYFGGSLSSFDNMVDRSPAQRLEIAGPPLRYLHHCNWKMLVENQTDTCHPMVAHESSAGTAVKLWEEMNPEEGAPKPPAMEIIAPFMSPYEFFEEMGIRTWPNGHGHTGVHHSIHSDYSAIPGYEDAMIKSHGEEKAKAVLGENRHNTVYFPNIMIKGPIQQLRNFIPLGADKTMVESYVYRLVDAPDQLLARSAMYNRMINAPTSIVGHDDMEMYERAQEGLMADGLEWVDIQRLYEDEEDFSEELVENGTTERQMRNQFDAWVKFMTASMPDDENTEGAA